MTKEEFAAGWKLLVMQPWGWRYNQLQGGQPTEQTQAQLEFYYDELKWAHPEAWAVTAKLYARGKEWPCVDDLQRSLRNLNSRYVPQLPVVKRAITRTEAPRVLRKITGGAA